MKIIEKLKELRVSVIGWEKETKELRPVSPYILPALLMIAEGAAKIPTRITNPEYGAQCIVCNAPEVDGSIQEHKKDCPAALIEQGLKDLKEVGE